MKNQRQNVDTEMLEVYTVLARERSFTRAAKVLGVRQSTVTRQVQRLEHAMGAQLLVRTHRGIVLTFAGERTIDWAHAVLGQLVALKGDLYSLQTEPSGVVRVGTMMSIGATFLPPIIESLSHRFEKARYVIQEGQSGDMGLLLSRGELDLGLYSGPIAEGMLVAKRLWTERYFVVIPHKHRCARWSQVNALRDLAKESFASLRSREALEALRNACLQHGGQPRIAIETDNLESVRSMVEANVCIAFLPSILKPIVARWHARSLDVIEGNAERDIFVVHRGRAHLSAAARVVREEFINASKRPGFVRSLR